jgi:hypothetical protein
VTLANAGAQALISYVGRTARSDQAQALFRRYQRAAIESRSAEAHTQSLLKVSSKPRSALTRAHIAEDLAQLRATDLANRYRAASGDSGANSRLTLIVPAADAKSDQRDVLERLLVIGAVGGLVLGLGLALLRTNWGVVRALRRA